MKPTSTFSNLRLLQTLLVAGSLMVFQSDVFAGGHGDGDWNDHSDDCHIDGSENMEAKVFGGGSVLPDLRSAGVGESNARFIVEYLRKERVQVLAQDLLDDCARKIYFFPATGRVLVKKLRQLHNATVLAREQDYSRRLLDVEVSGEVELFR